MSIKNTSVYRFAQGCWHSFKLFAHKLYTDPMRRRYVERQYEKAAHKKLDWDNLRTYNEKMQFEKLYNLDPRKTRLTDKLEARSYVEEIIGVEHLVPIISIGGGRYWTNPDEIDFSAFPDAFVLKTTHASGLNIIVRDKAAMDERKVRRQLKRWMKLNYAYVGFEMHYKDIPPRIYAEELLRPASGEEPDDYKFLCFGGKPYYVWVDKDRHSDHKRNVYDLDWNLQEWNQYFYGNYAYDIPKPQNFPEMKAIAEKLCRGFPHVRVDLYNVDGGIYFSELTFTNGSGLEMITPETSNLLLGNLWDMRVTPSAVHDSRLSKGERK